MFPSLIFRANSVFQLNNLIQDGSVTYTRKVVKMTPPNQPLLSVTALKKSALQFSFFALRLNKGKILRKTNCSCRSIPSYKEEIPFLKLYTVKGMGNRES